VRRRNFVLWQVVCGDRFECSVVFLCCGGYVVGALKACNPHPHIAGFI